MDKPIRVLQVLSILNQGGAENMVMNLYREIDRSQVQFDFIVHTNEQGAFDAEVESLGGAIYHAPRYTGFNHFQYVRWWKKFLTEHSEYRILHSHIRSYASIYIPIAKKHGLKTIIHSHSTSNGKGFAAVVKKLLQYRLRYQADYFFACSKEAGKWLFGEKVVEKNNFKVICNGINCDRFRYNEADRLLIRKEYGIENNFVIGHVGRHTVAKNPIFLIEVFAEIYKCNKNARFLQVGQGEVNEQMKQKCCGLGIQDAVIFAGVHNDVEKYYSAMDVFLFPSLWEGLPVTLVEAQANGLMCVVSDVITREVIISDKLFSSVSLKSDVVTWAGVVLNRKNNVVVRSIDEAIVNSGFNIKRAASDLFSFYETII